MYARNSIEKARQKIYVDISSYPHGGPMAAHKEHQFGLDADLDCVFCRNVGDSNFNEAKWEEFFTICAQDERIKKERMMRKLRGSRWALLIPLTLFVLEGCALQYYDPATQTDHLWGIGHFKMKVAPANEGVQAIVKGATVVGASVKVAPDDTHVAIGYDKTSQIAVVNEGASVRLEWPNSNPFRVRVGTRPPFLPSNEETDSKGPETGEGENK